MVVSTYDVYKNNDIKINIDKKLIEFGFFAVFAILLSFAHLLTLL